MKPNHLLGSTRQVYSMLWEVLLYSGVCRNQVSRHTPFLGRSLQEVLFCWGEIGTIVTILFARRACLFTKTGYKGPAERRFSGAPPHTLLSHCPGEMPLLRVWLLGAWWDPGGCSECRGLKEIALSLLLFDSEILNTRGSIQGMMECLTEAAICSQLANRDLFGQGVQPSTQQTSAFRWVHRRKKEML